MVGVADDDGCGKHDEGQGKGNVMVLVRCVRKCLLTFRT